jgi:hypothetical protein
MSDSVVVIGVVHVLEDHAVKLDILKEEGRCILLIGGSLLSLVTG